MVNLLQIYKRISGNNPLFFFLLGKDFVLKDINERMWLPGDPQFQLRQSEDSYSLFYPRNVYYTRSSYEDKVLRE